MKNMYIKEINNISNKNEEAITAREYCEYTAIYTNLIMNQLKEIAMSMKTDFDFDRDDVVIKYATRGKIDQTNLIIGVEFSIDKGYRIVNLYNDGDCKCASCDSVYIDKESINKILKLCELHYQYFNTGNFLNIGKENGSILNIYHSHPGFQAINHIGFTFQKWCGYPEGISADIDIDFDSSIPIYKDFKIDERNIDLNSNEKNEWLDNVKIDQDKLPGYLINYIENIKGKSRIKSR